MVMEERRRFRGPPRVSKEELEFLIQSCVVFVVISVSLYNLTVNPTSSPALWISLLSCGFGIFVPGPSVKRSLAGKQKQNENGGELNVSQ